MRTHVRTKTPVRITYLTAGRGAWSWLFSTDHKRVSILYLLTITVLFLTGAAIAGILRVESLTPAGELLQPEVYGRLFTLHGVLMVFFFLLPCLSAVLGNFLVPLVVGTRNVAFPRLNLLGWYLFLFGGASVFWSALHGGADSGWTLARPEVGLQSAPELAWMAVGVLAAGLSAALMALNLIATVLRGRRESASGGRAFVWGIAVHAWVSLLTTPALLLALVLLLTGRVEGLSTPPPEADATALYRLLLAIYAHAAVHAPLLVGMGIATELLAVFSGRSVASPRALATLFTAIALFGSLSFGQNLFPDGLGLYARTASSLFALLVAVPCAALLAYWTAMLYHGTVRLASPMLFGLSFLFLFLIGGASGLPLGTVTIGAHLRGTVFGVAHFHYFIAGGALTAFLGGLHYWWPKMTGRLYNETLARFAAILIFIGFNTMFLPQFVLGYLGKPARASAYAPRFQVYEVLSSGGATLLLAGLGLPSAYLLWSFFAGRRAGDNPWTSSGREWELPSPPDPARSAE